jgi:hypothetical protein
MVSKTEYTSNFIKNYAESPGLNFVHPAYNKNMPVVSFNNYDFSRYTKKFESEVIFSSEYFNLSGPTFCMPELLNFSL